MSPLNPFTLEIPERLETPRLILTAPRVEDAPFINAGVLASFSELQPFMEWAQTPPTLEQSLENARRKVADWAIREHLDYRLWLREGGEFAGCCGLHTFNWSVPKGEIGYWLRSDLGGRGLMGEAVAALRDLALDLGFARVEIRCERLNVRSARVAEKAGFSLDGELVNNWRGWDGNLKTTRIFSIVNNPGSESAREGD